MKKIRVKSIILLVVMSILVSMCSIAVAADDTSYVPAEVRQIIQELNASDSGIPATITKDDIERVIKEGGSEGIKAMNHVYETAIPIDPPPINENEIESYSEEVEDHYSYTYNLETGNVVYEDGSEFEHPVEQPDSGGITQEIGRAHV